MKTDSKKTDAAMRRKALRDLCQGLRAQQLAAEQDITVNDVLKHFYATQGHIELKTYNQWREEGYHVRKGEKAILLWGKPHASKKSKELAAQAGKDEEEAREDFYPLAYLFSNKQVERVG